MAARGDFVTTARQTLVRMLCDEYDADPDFEKSQRVARALETDRRRAVVWVRLILAEAWGTRRQLLQLGFDRSVVDAPPSWSSVERRGVLEYARRVAACRDLDVIAVAVAALDDEIDEGGRASARHAGGLQGGTPRAEARRWRPAPGGLPQAGEAADDRPPADLSDELLAVVDHADGAQDAMRRMLRERARDSGGATSACLRTDRDLLVGTLHDLLQVVGVLVFEVTARRRRRCAEDRAALAKAGTGANPTKAMETMALTIVHRLQEFHAAAVATSRRTGKAD